MATMSGASVPDELAEKLLGRGRPAGRGAQSRSRACHGALPSAPRWGAPGLHFYTMNRAAATMEVCANLGWRPRRSRSPRGCGAALRGSVLADRHAEARPSNRPLGLEAPSVGLGYCPPDSLFPGAAAPAYVRDAPYQEFAGRFRQPGGRAAARPECRSAVPVLQEGCEPFEQLAQPREVVGAELPSPLALDFVGDRSGRRHKSPAAVSEVDALGPPVVGTVSALEVSPLRVARAGSSGPAWTCRPAPPGRWGVDRRAPATAGPPGARRPDRRIRVRAGPRVFDGGPHQPGCAGALRAGVGQRSSAYRSRGRRGA